jgi:N-acetylneuraminate synthase/N,N'-diacetyllegionaminate synthase
MALGKFGNKMKIGEFDLDKDVLVVAEIGNNHEGSFPLAEEMIGLAARAGADAVKFQVIVPDRLVTIRDRARIQQLEKFRLSYEEFERLSKVAKREGVLFLATPFDVESARFLEPLVPAYKISSGDNDFYPLLDVIARTGKPVIMSTGLADMQQISGAKLFIEKVWRECGIDQEMAILHCVTSYPTKLSEANLLTIKTLRERLGVTVGYSDHTIGIDAAVLSVALEARIIEKHFTLDKNYSDFRDHQLSAAPEEFARLVKRVGKTIAMLGDGAKCLQEGEKEIINKVRRSIVASRDLDKGTVLCWDDLAWVRPAGGLPIGCEGEIIDKALARCIQRGEMITVGDVCDSVKG